MKNQFEFGKVITGPTFLNRDDERKKLSVNVTSGVNTILISPRRWGKTSLVAQSGIEISDSSTIFCYFDLFKIRNEEEFYQKFATQIIKSTSTRWEEWIETGKKFIKNLIPRFSIGDDPMHDFTITLDYKAVKESAEEVLELPEKIAKEKGIRLVVCIDEFQNISFFDEPLLFQKQLRSYWQYHRETCYIIYGSKKHLMAELFQNSRMPFYRFGDLISLRKIKREYWIPYIIEGFKVSGKKISSEEASLIPEWMDDHPYYVQFLSYQCWSITDTRCSRQILEQALRDILNQQSMLFQRETDSLTNFQLNYLKAVASGEVHFSSVETLKKYHLGSPGNIKRIRSALENKELIDITGKKIEIADPVFKIWIQQNFL